MSEITSNRQRTLQGEAVLRALLRSPKTRDGLIAAVAGKGLSKHFVFGFLSVAVRDGEVVRVRTGKVETFQLAERFSVEEPAPGVWPTWMDPRTLPVVCSRRIFLTGRPAEEQPMFRMEETCD